MQVVPVYESFSAEPAAHWRTYLVGGGSVECSGQDAGVRLVMHGATSQGYSDAQVDDYQITPAGRFRWRPPLRMVVRARFSHPSGVLQGTAGFGFWNYPFLLPAGRLPTLPRAVWFFYASSPSNMKLDQQTPGQGWKVATIDALCPSALLLAPLAPLAVPLMRSRTVYRHIWPPIQRSLRIAEAAIPAAQSMTDWHIYTIEWGTSHTRFRVDGHTVLDHAPSPGGPQCFVLWMDNQYMIVTPWGTFGWGLLTVPVRQWVEVDWLAIEPLMPGMPGMPDGCAPSSTSPTPTPSRSSE